MKTTSVALCGLSAMAGIFLGECRAAPPQPPLPAAAAAAALNLGLPRQLPRDADAAQRISLKSFAAMIADADESVRAQRLEETVANEGIRGAAALFEPFAFVAVERENMHVLNSALEAKQRGLNPGDIFDQVELRIKTGFMSKAPTGADMEISYNTTELKNSVQPLANAPTPEHKGYFGFKVTQPLIRGGGYDVTVAPIVIAEAEKAVATESIRQVLAQRVLEGVHGYIFVQRAEERVRLRRAALQVAAESELEIASQNAAGLRSISELTEARASLALRRAQLAQAEQDLLEQRNALQAFVAARTRDGDAPLRQSRLLPGDPLVLVADDGAAAAKLASEEAYERHLDDVMSRRPEARVNDWRIRREGHKVGLAKDQTLPELNLTVRSGIEDLGSQYRPLRDYFDKKVPYYSWMVGLVLKVGLFGDEKKDSEYQTAKLRRHQAELAKGAMRQRIANEVVASTSVLDQAVQQAARQRDIVLAQRDLVRAEQDLLKEGRRSRLDVLKKQIELLTAEEALVDATAQANRASYLASQVDGSLLARVGLE